MFRKIYEFLRILRSAIYSGLFVQIVTQVYILNKGITLIPTILVKDAIVSEITGWRVFFWKIVGQFLIFFHRFAL